MSGRRLARRELVPHNRAENPHLANHLAGDRHLRDVWLLAGADHAVVAGAVALVAFDRLGLDGRRHLVALAFPLRCAVEVGQARYPLYDGAPHGGVACLGDGAVVPGLLAAVAPRGHKPEVARYAASAPEAREVVHRRAVRQGRDVVDALQPRERIDVRLEAGRPRLFQDLLPHLVAALHVRQRRLDVELEGRPLRALRQLDRLRPCDVLPGPGGAQIASGRALVPDEAVAQQHRRGLHLEDLRGLDGIVVRAHKVAGRLCVLGRYPDRLALALGVDERLEQRVRVAAVVLHPLRLRAPGYARHCDDVAVVAKGADIARELEAAGARLVREPHRRRGPGGRPRGDLLGGWTVREPSGAALPGREVYGRRRHRPGMLVQRNDGGVLGVDDVVWHGSPFP